MAFTGRFNGDEDYDPHLVEIVLAVALCVLALLFLIVGVTVYEFCVKHRRRRGSLRRRLARSVADHEGVGLRGLHLDRSVVETFPVFVYRCQEQQLDCAVCLSEFEENDKGRMLPRCKHSFHVDCIDKWFESQSACPLCRTVLRAEETAAVSDHAIVRVDGEISERETEAIQTLQSQDSLAKLELSQQILKEADAASSE